MAYVIRSLCRPAPGSLARGLACVVALWLTLYPPGSAGGIEEEYSERHDSVLGATFAITLVGLDDGEARRVAAAVLEDVARLESIFGQAVQGTVEGEGIQEKSIQEKNVQGGGGGSELARLNEAGGARSLSPELADLLRLCEHWRRETSGAFSCRLGTVLDIWREAEQSGEVPERPALRRMARDLDGLPWQLAGNGIDLGGMRLAPGALAAGYAADVALARARSLAPGALGIAIDIGGHGIYWGRAGDGEPWRAAIAERGAGAPDYGALVLDGAAVAYSGGHGQRRVGDRRFSRLISPLDGWPATFAPRTLVVAKDAATAAALAQALTAMPMAQGIALIDGLADAEALIVTETDKTFASRGWYERLAPDERHRTLWSGDRQFLVEYQIPAHDIAEYRRPYVAVWITDSGRKLVRQLAVHGENSRWLRDIPLWWRRHGRRDESVIDGLTRATPMPGHHALTWDGRDDTGAGVPEGDYILHIEAAREHGGREVLTLPFSVTDKAFEQKASGATELGAVRVSLGSAP